MSNKISVLMSVFNDEENVENAILGILNQTYRNFEFLIVDDASTDSTNKIIGKYQKRDKRIKLFRNEKNIGLTKSLNHLLKIADGEFIARQDSDDISLIDRFEKQLYELNSKDVVGCSTRAIIKNSSRITPNKSYYFPKKFVMNIKNPFVHGSLFIYKSEILSIGGYDEEFYYAQDYKLMADLLVVKKKVTILKEPLYILNLSNNISTKFRKEQKYFADCVKSGKTPSSNGF